MARPSCTTVRLFGASPCCNFCACKCVCTVVPQGGVGDRHLATVPQGVVGDRLPWGGERQGGGGVHNQGSITGVHDTAESAARNRFLVFCHEIAERVLLGHGLQEAPCRAFLSVYLF